MSPACHRPSPSNQSRGQPAAAYHQLTRKPSALIPSSESGYHLSIVHPSKGPCLINTYQSPTSTFFFLLLLPASICCSLALLDSTRLCVHAHDNTHEEQWQAGAPCSAMCNASTKPWQSVSCLCAIPGPSRLRSRYTRMRGWAASADSLSTCLMPPQLPSALQ
jgi:hypothetical protein